MSPSVPRPPSTAGRFLPQTLREYALLADGERGALIGPHGNIVWLCAPQWHDDAVFSALLGGQSGYAITPVDPYVWGGYYEPGMLIWHSRWVTQPPRWVGGRPDDGPDRPGRRTPGPGPGDQRSGPARAAARRRPCLGRHRERLGGRGPRPRELPHPAGRAAVVCRPAWPDQPERRHGGRRHHQPAGARGNRPELRLPLRVDPRPVLRGAGRGRGGRPPAAAGRRRVRHRPAAGRRRPDDPRLHLRRTPGPRPGGTRPARLPRADTTASATGSTGSSSSPDGTGRRHLGDRQPALDAQPADLRRGAACAGGAPPGRRRGRGLVDAGRRDHRRDLRRLPAPDRTLATVARPTTRAGRRTVGCRHCAEQCPPTTRGPSPRWPRTNGS